MIRSSTPGTIAGLVVFESMIAACLALTVAALVVGIGIWRRAVVPAASAGLIVAGLITLAISAGRPRLTLSRAPRVVVLVDHSPSTRTAAYHNPEQLQMRIRQLLAGTAADVLVFGTNQSEQTELPPVAADAIVLFSDAQFAPPPSLAPVYVVVDPALEISNDASVEQLERRDSEIVVRTDVAAAARLLRVNGGSPRPVEPGQHDQTVPLPADGRLVATLDPLDAWPENDQLVLHVAAEEKARWWIGDACPAGWIPTGLPEDPLAYLRPSLIAMNNTDARQLTEAQLAALARYVRDLGGGLLLVGGDHAFGAGGYLGTPLESLSPLSSAAPEAARHWILLLDASGSMERSADGASRWQRACDVLPSMVRSLPPKDTLSVGAFARDLTWWLQGRSVEQSNPDAWPIATTAPRGPTNLQPVIQQIATQSDAGMPAEIIVISDCDAPLDDPATLAGALINRRARVHLLVTSAAPRDAVQRLAELTGGQVLRQSDWRKWADAAREILSRGGQPGWVSQRVRIDFTDETGIPAAAAGGYNITWLKPSAAELARAKPDRPAAAVWQVGAGKVAAMAWAADSASVQRIAERVARQPRDPRFSVQTIENAQTTLRIDAIQDGAFINNLPITIDVGDGPLAAVQVAPGRYELSIPRSRTPRIATIRTGEQLIDRVAVAGRYPPEFDQIGNNRNAMRELATRSGGAVIGPTQVTPIPFRHPRPQVPIASACAACGALLIGLGLVRLRRA